MSDQEVVIKCRVWGGEGSGVLTSKLAPKLSPLGVPPPKVVQDIAKATQKFAGFRASVRVIVCNRQFRVELEDSTPTLLIAALNEGHRDRKKTKKVKHNGNLTLDQIIDIARTMRPKSCARTLAGTVKEVLGTAQAMGVATIDGKYTCKDAQQKITKGEIQIPEN